MFYFLKRNSLHNDKLLVKFTTDFCPDNLFYDKLLARNFYDEAYCFRPVLYEKPDVEVVFQDKHIHHKFSGSSYKIWSSFEPSYSFTKQFNSKFLDNYQAVIYHNLDAFIEKKRHIHYFEEPMWLPWFTEKNARDIVKTVPPKTDNLSVILSGKSILPERKNIYSSRLEFISKLFSSDYDFDFYGYGIPKAYTLDNRYKGELIDKYEGLLKYKYSICIENGVERNYVSEKFYDCINCETLPIYYGAPNIDELVDNKTYLKIDDLSNVDVIFRDLNSLDYNDLVPFLKSLKYTRLNRDLFNIVDEKLSIIFKRK